MRNTKVKEARNADSEQPTLDIALVKLNNDKIEFTFLKIPI